MMIGVSNMMTSKDPDPIGGLVLVVLPVLTFVVLFLERRMVERSVKSSPAFGSRVQYRFSEDAFALQTSGAQSSASWTQVLETKLTPAGALIYMQRLMFYWVPKTAFASEADYNRFLAILSDKTKHSKLG